jgi:hypothetical protein
MVKIVKLCAEWLFSNQDLSALSISKTVELPPYLSNTALQPQKAVMLGTATRAAKFPKITSTPTNFELRKRQQATLAPTFVGYKTNGNGGCKCN